MVFIEEVANSASVSAPGWAYVPDTGFDPSKAPIQPSARKRNARIQQGGDTTARQSNAILKRLAELDKDNFKDTHIPVPTRQKEGGGRSKGKTAATRKILLAQKNFTNYLADEEALAAQEPQPTVVKPKNATPQRRPSSRAKVESSTTSVGPNETPADQVPSGFLGGSYTPIDDSRLLQSVVPPEPSEALLEALVTAPPLSFNAARGQPLIPGRPQRHFCELCGYWGTIRCLQCGARVCGLPCKRTHDEDRCQRYSV